jgi:hypothetical protein
MSPVGLPLVQEEDADGVVASVSWTSAHGCRSCLPCSKRSPLTRRRWSRPGCRRGPSTTIPAQRALPWRFAETPRSGSAIDHAAKSRRWWRRSSPNCRPYCSLSARCGSRSIASCRSSPRPRRISLRRRRCQSRHSQIGASTLVRRDLRRVRDAASAKHLPDTRRCRSPRRGMERDRSASRQPGRFVPMFSPTR